MPGGESCLITEELGTVREISNFELREGRTHGPNRQPVDEEMAIHAKKAIDMCMYSLVDVVPIACRV